MWCTIISLLSFLQLHFLVIKLFLGSENSLSFSFSITDVFFYMLLIS